MHLEERQRIMNYKENLEIDYLHKWEISAVKNAATREIADRLVELRKHKDEILPKVFCNTEENLLLDLFKLAYAKK